MEKTSTAQQTFSAWRADDTLCSDAGASSTMLAGPNGDHAMHPIVVASGEVPPAYLEPGLELLLRGGSALDAVELVARAVERDPTFRSVGLGGLPNIRGEVELDALIMDGETLEAGAVAGIRHFVHAISIARAVLTDLPHVLLIGEGAEQFAREYGFEEERLLTDESARRHRNKLVELDGKLEGKPDTAGRLAALVAESMKTHRDGDTMNTIALDGDGRLAVAVTTSGLAWKYPGRVGDSPVPGAGAYADNRYGACAATGLGELVLRSGTSLRAILYHAGGMDAAAAGRAALGETAALSGAAGAKVRLLFVTPGGDVRGFATWPGAEIIVAGAGAPSPRRLPCEVVDPPITP